MCNLKDARLNPFAGRGQRVANKRLELIIQDTWSFPDWLVRRYIAAYIKHFDGKSGAMSVETIHTLLKKSSRIGLFNMFKARETGN